MEKKENLNLILLNVACKYHNADWNWKSVNSPFARIYMVESGSANVIMPDGVHVIEPGYLYLIPAYVTHSYENNSIFVLHYIHVYEEQNIFERLNFPFKVPSGELETALIRRLHAINPGRGLIRSDPMSYDNTDTLIQSIVCNDKFPFYTVVETKGILLQLFSKFLEKASLKQEIIDERIIKAVHYIRKNIDKNITINELSDICYLSDDHFIRLFKKEMRCTPIRYINQKKIERAQLMLIVSDKSIKNIAFDLAFDNLFYFYRLFKKITGLPPDKYKKNLILNK